jgi:hypothetical protein
MTKKHIVLMLYAVIGGCLGALVALLSGVTSWLEARTYIAVGVLVSAAGASLVSRMTK